MKKGADNGNRDFMLNVGQRQMGTRAKEGVFVLDSRGAILSAGGAVRKDGQGDPTVLAGDCAFELLTPGSVDRSLGYLSEALKNNFPVRFAAQEGGRLLRISVHPLAGEKRGETKAAVFWHDVTSQERTKSALRGSERRFRGLLKDSLAGVCLIQDGKVVYENPEHARFFGQGAASGPANVLAQSHPEDNQRVGILLESLYKGDIERLNVDFRLFPVQDPGSFHWIQYRANWVRHGQGKALLINVMDITTAKQLEHLVDRDKRMSLLGRMVTGIAHEIRNPLSLINVHLALLKQSCSQLDNLEGAQKKRVVKCMGEIGQASNVIRDVVKRIQNFSDPHVPRPAPIDINTCVRDAVGLSAETLRCQGIVMETALGEALPLCMADSQSVGQVLLILIQNAAEALEGIEEKKLVQVKTFRDKGRVAISVGDTGPGIPPAMWETIFDPFFTTRDKGSGMGLSIARRIMADQEGALEVGQSRLGGARFSVYFPLANGRGGERIQAAE